MPSRLHTCAHIWGFLKNWTLSESFPVTLNLQPTSLWSEGAAVVCPPHPICVLLTCVSFGRSRCQVQGDTCGAPTGQNRARESILFIVRLSRLSLLNSRRSQSWGIHGFRATRRRSVPPFRLPALLWREIYMLFQENGCFLSFYQTSSCSRPAFQILRFIFRS